MAKGAAILAGFVLAGLAMYSALLLAWGGEGWNEPANCSLILFIVYPVALARMVDAERMSVRIDVVLLLVAALFDAYLVLSTWFDGYRYFHRVLSSTHAAPIAWAALWFLWQLLTVATIAIRIRRRAAAAEPV